MKGLKIPFYTDPRLVVLEAPEKLEYPRPDIMRAVDKRYLETLMTKVTESWKERFNPTKRKTVGKMSHCKRSISAELKELLKQNVGRPFVDYTTSIGIRPEEFGDKRLTTLVEPDIMNLLCPSGYRWAKWIYR
jgi:hypothetical protein